MSGLAEDLTALVHHTYAAEMTKNARFRHTVAVALQGTTDRDVLAMLVRGLVESCADTETLRSEMVKLAEVTPIGAFSIECPRLRPTQAAVRAVHEQETTS